MFEFISIKEVGKELDYKDCRSVMKWCNNNGIGILGDKRKYVIKIEFEVAKMKEAFGYLKNKYGESNFMEILNAHASFLIEYKTAIERKANSQQKDKNSDEYTSQGFYEKQFLDELRKI